MDIYLSICLSIYLSIYMDIYMLHNYIIYILHAKMSFEYVWSYMIEYVLFWFCLYIYSLLWQDLSTIQRKGMLKVGFYWLRAGAHDNDVHARSANGYLDWRSLETFCAVRDIRFNGDAMCTNCMHTYIIYIHIYIYVCLYIHTHNRYL
jgi:hypothetical protein